MQQIILNIEENRYAVLLQFLKTLDYVKIVQANQFSSPVSSEPASNLSAPVPNNQLALLKQVLEKNSIPLFQHISDPVAWQKQQRDEWS
jgi:hypothetical protein